MADRPNDRNKKIQLKSDDDTSCHRYVIDQNIETVSIGLGWTLYSNDDGVVVVDNDDDINRNEDENDNKKLDPVFLPSLNNVFERKLLSKL